MMIDVGVAYCRHVRVYCIEDCVCSLTVCFSLYLSPTDRTAYRVEGKMVCCVFYIL